MARIRICVKVYRTAVLCAALLLLMGGTAWAQSDLKPYSMAPQLDASPDMDEAEERSVTRVSRVIRASPPASPANEADLEGGEVLLDLDFISVNMPPEGDAPTDMAFSADGSTFIISHRDSRNLVVFDAETRNVLAAIPLSGSPNSLALTSDGGYAVTANLFEDTVSIVDLRLGAEVAVVPVGAQPGIVRIAPDDSKAVVGNTLDGDLSIIELSSMQEIDRLPAADFSQAYSFGPFGFDLDFTPFEINSKNTLIFPAFFDDQILFIDLETGTTTAVASQPKPAFVDLSRDGKTAVVSHGSDSRVTVVDMSTETLTKSIFVGGTPNIFPIVAINPEKTKAVVSVLNAVRIVDLETEAVSGDLSTGTVNGLLTSFDGSYCVMGNFQGSLVDWQADTLISGLISSWTPDELAVSPAGPRAATAHSLRKEHTEVIHIDGKFGFLEGEVPTGPQPEGDRARDVAVSLDGSQAVVINNHSQNATMMDLEKRVVTGVVPVGQRPGAVAITPDGTTAVVANLDSPFASVIDLASGTVEEVAISRRGSRVAIAPNGKYAYIPVVADGDGVWRINLQTLSPEGPRIFTGNMGGIGLGFDQASGMTLSPDGSTLVTCGSYSDDISIIDTATWTEISRVPVGDFPVRAVFSRDSETIYVSNRNESTVSVVSRIGDQWSQVDRAWVGAYPLELALDPAGEYLYVGNYQDRLISVVDTASRDVVDSILLPQPGGAGQPVGLHVSRNGKQLYVAANGGDFHVIDTSTRSYAATVNTGLAPAAMVFSEATGCAHIAAPLGEDGLFVICVSAAGQIFVDGFESGSLSAWQ